MGWGAQAWSWRQGLARHAGGTSASSHGSCEGKSSGERWKRGRHCSGEQVWEDQEQGVRPRPLQKGRVPATDTGRI